MTEISVADLETEIEAGWEARDTLNPQTKGPIRTAVEETLMALDSGRLRVAHKVDGEWLVRQWAKKAVLLSFRLNANSLMQAGAMGAQVGKNVHLSGGVGLGGVLEPLQANPTIIEDNCFIGARSEVVEGVIIGEGSVLSMGVFITSSTKIVVRATGEILRGKVPPYSVVVPGTLPGKAGEPALSCAVIVKTVDAQTRSKTSVNDLLRD